MAGSVRHNELQISSYFSSPRAAAYGCLDAPFNGLVRVKVLCGVCRQPLAACVSRTLRVSRKPFDMPPRIIQAPTESWFYLLLPSTRFTQPFLSPLSFNVAPSCLARHKALHRALVQAAVFLCVGQVEAVSCTAQTVVPHLCCIEKCKQGLICLLSFLTADMRNKAQHRNPAF